MRQRSSLGSRGARVSGPHIDIIRATHQYADVRTTIDLDDDLTEKLRRLAHKQGTSLKHVVNQAIRRGLSSQEPPRRRRAPFRVKPFHSAFRPGVDLLKLNQLVDDLEIQDRLAR